MARMPGVTWVGEKSPRRAMDRYDLVIIHTIVGYAPAHAAHFSTDGAGKIWQSRDTRYRSAASLNGNHRSVSIENADHGPQFPKWNTRGDNVPAFTARQMDAIAEICAWAHETHGIPLVAVPDSKPSRRGIGWHRLGCDPYRVAGGELWSSAYGKVCPGDRRIAQIPEIIRRAKAIVAGTPTPTPRDWFDMATEADLRKILREEGATARNVMMYDISIGGATKDYVGKDSTNAASLLRYAGAATFDGRRQHSELRGELAGLSAAVAQLAVGQGIDPDAIEAAARRGAEAGAAAAIDDIIDDAEVTLNVSADEG